MIPRYIQCRSARGFKGLAKQLGKLAHNSMARRWSQRWQAPNSQS